MSNSDVVREFYEKYFAQKANEELLRNAQQSNSELLKSFQELARERLKRRARKAEKNALGSMQERFDTAVKKLGKDDRQIIAMRHDEKLTNRQVAKQLGVSEPIASMQYLRAVRRLMKVISGE